MKTINIKNIATLVLLLIINFLGAQSGAKITWSVGDVSVDCENNKICYPIMVKSNENQTLLSYTTLRMFYDPDVINNLSINNIENGYQIQLAMQTFPTIGDEFGFQSDRGAFPRISLSPNTSNYLPIIKNKPTHVFDLCFNINESPIPDKLFAPLIFDNTHTTKEKGIKSDTGYFIGDAGIATQYRINGIDFEFEADDEADHFNWVGEPNFEGKLNKQGQTIGKKSNVRSIRLNCESVPEDDIYSLEGVDVIFGAYPNPFKTNINLTYNIPFDTEVKIEVYSLSGFLIKRFENKSYIKDSDASFLLNFSKNPDQMYIVSLITNKGIVSKKIVSAKLKRED